MKRNFNRTKIVATVGPASRSRADLEKLVRAGADLFRINFSHGSHEEYAKVIEYINEINVKLNTNVGILGDLQGPKIRIGEIEGSHVILKDGSEVTISTKEHIGSKDSIFITYKQFPKDVKAKDSILLDDGKIELEVIRTNKKDMVKAKVIYGGALSSRKGVNLPNTRISLPCLTEKDKNDLKFALKHELNWIALSFVRSAKDIKELRKIIDKSKKQCKIVAKIEKPQALEDIGNILEETDAIMIARGDLGVEVPMEDLPGIQKELVEKCIKASKPVIIATQVMENMIGNPSPTRAEVTDVANAVYDGADAVMLSGETSIGRFPIKVIETISKIIDKVEDDENIYLSYEGRNKWDNLPVEDSKTFLSDAICYNAAALSVKVQARAIIGMTKSGYTAFKTSSYRPRAKIFIFTENRFLLNILSLVWGAKGVYYNKFVSTDQTIKDVKNILKKEGYLKKRRCSY